MSDQSIKRSYVKPNVRDLSYMPLAQGACASGTSVGNCTPHGGLAGSCTGGQYAGTGTPESCAIGTFPLGVTNSPCAVGSVANNCTLGGYATP